jgi:endonuclease-3
MKIQDIDRVMAALERATQKFAPPLINSIIDEFGHDPFLILIGCLLSLRVRDSTTIHVVRVLFNRVRTPQQLIDIPDTELEQIVFKTVYYKQKAALLKSVSREILERFGGSVPRAEDELRSINGVGPKTANLVLGMAFGVPAICVDTHVHRISNRLGLIKTRTVEETEEALKQLLPQKYWIPWNKLLVVWGQNICAPISPKCSICPINTICQRVGVTQYR